MFIYFLQSFFLGLTVAGTALIAQILLATVFKYEVTALNLINTQSLVFLALFVFTEEFLKYLVIDKKISRNDFKKSVTMTGAWIFGLGFSFLEIIITLSKENLDNLSISDLAMSKVVILHIFTSGLLLYASSLNKERKTGAFFVFLSVLVAHFVYNFSVLYFPDLVSNIVETSILIILIIVNIYAFIVNKKLASRKKISYN